MGFKKRREMKIFVVIVIISIVLAVAYALYLIGTPEQQRTLQFDRTRVSDLAQISSGVSRYWATNEELPKTLEDLREQSSVFIRSVEDPETQEPYEYTIIDENSYELCAVFKTASDSKIFSQQQWDHGIGRTCFDREAQDSVSLPLIR